MVNGDFHYFFSVEHFFFFSCDFSVFTRRMNFSTFFCCRVLRSFVFNCEFSNFTRRSGETCILNIYIYIIFFSNYMSFLHQIRMENNIILGISPFFGWNFLHFLTVNSSCYPKESNSLHSEARFSLFFSFSTFFSRGMQQSPIFLLSLIFCKKKIGTRKHLATRRNRH